MGTRRARAEADLCGTEVTLRAHRSRLCDIAREKPHSVTHSYAPSAYSTPGAGSTEPGGEQERPDAPSPVGLTSEDPMFLPSPQFLPIQPWMLLRGRASVQHGASVDMARSGWGIRS